MIIFCPPFLKKTVLVQSKTNAVEWLSFIESLTFDAADSYLRREGGVKFDITVQPSIIKKLLWSLTETPRIHNTCREEKIMRKLSLVIIAAIFILCSAHDSNALCVRVAKANLRTGPGTSYDIVWEIFKYMPLVKVGVSLSGKWYAVKDVDGDVTWIHKDLVTTGYHCAVVKSETVNVRTGPGTRYRKSSISPAKQYYSFKVERRKGNWVRIRDEWGGRGWISRKFLFIQ